MEIKLNLRKTLEETANEYFEKAKKLRRKAAGARKTVDEHRKKLEQLEKKREKEIAKLMKQKQESRKRTAPKEWYEKFRWFVSSEGFLCIGGRDATTNELVIKKHTDADDAVFHTDMAGSPFFVIKTAGKKPGEKTLQETADATAIFSKGWKIGLAGMEVFSVKPEQVSKKAQSGEYMTKGSFMIRGKRTKYRGKMEAAVGLLESGRAMCGPESAVRSNCKEFAILSQGKDKPSDCAKEIAKKLKVHVDDILPLLPAGTCEVKK